MLKGEWSPKLSGSYEGNKGVYIYILPGLCWDYMGMFFHCSLLRTSKLKQSLYIPHIPLYQQLEFLPAVLLKHP